MSLGQLRVAVATTALSLSSPPTQRSVVLVPVAHGDDGGEHDGLEQMVATAAADGRARRTSVGRKDRARWWSSLTRAGSAVRWKPRLQRLAQPKRQRADNCAVIRA